MAMTKAEKAEMAALRVRCALAWPPEPPAPVDLQVAKEASGAVWLHLWFFNRHRGIVGLGVTNGNSLSAPTNYTDDQLDARHGGGTRVYLSQGPGGPWYGTQLEALRALHYAVALECAEKLAQLIERVNAAPSPSSDRGGS